MKQRILVILLALLAGGTVCAQWSGQNLHRVTSTLSNIEFAVHNSGLLYGDYWLAKPPSNTIDGFSAELIRWPRGSRFFGSMMVQQFKGLIFLAKRDTQYLFREATAISELPEFSHGPFYGMVPGRVGDPNAGCDARYNGAGWLYTDDADYIVYSSLDYDSNGVDVSGNNNNDWPVRNVGGSAQYIADPLMRSRYRPSFSSDEDLFTVFKDTDTRAYRRFQTSEPLGLEIHQYTYSWEGKGLRDIFIMRYDIINKGRSRLDSCLVLWGNGIEFWYEPMMNLALRDYMPVKTMLDPASDMLFQVPSDTLIPGHNPRQEWSGIIPAVGTSHLSSAVNGGADIGLKDGGSTFLFSALYPLYQNNHVIRTVSVFDDSIASEKRIYQRLIQKKQTIATPSKYDYEDSGALLSNPFTLEKGDTMRWIVGVHFGVDTSMLRMMNGMMKRMVAHSMTPPTPPMSPKVIATPMNRGVYLTWDDSAESSTDPIVLTGTSKPFFGYRVYRSTAQTSPFRLLRTFPFDSLAHDFLDVGSDLGGLKNNVTYHYKVVSYDQGDSTIGLESMESPAITGRNFLSVTPSEAPGNITAPPTTGTPASGLVGDLGPLRLHPSNVTNYRAFFEGRPLEVSLTTVSNGLKYLFPVTVKDTAYGRVHNDVLDIGLSVHGSPEKAGMKTGTVKLPNIFGLGGADLSVGYSYEQLADSFTVSGIVSSTLGADVPVIVRDSLGYTGIITIDPATSAARRISIRFLAGGVDTVSTLFQRYLPYLTVQVWDETHGHILDSGYTFTGYGVKSGTTMMMAGKPNRYYIGGTLSNGETWYFGHVLVHYNSRVVLDRWDVGAGSGKTGGSLFWGSVHRSGTKDFSAGDRVTVEWSGGVRGVFPAGARISVKGTSSHTVEATEEVLKKVRVVPNPYLVHHEAQRGTGELYFNYLPEECTIRIYTMALDLVKTIEHRGGSRAVWNLQTEGGQQVASQMLYAHIQTSNGVNVIKPFSVIIGR